MAPKLATAEQIDAWAKNAIGQLLAERDKNGDPVWTASRLAAEIGVSKSHVSRIQNEPGYKSGEKIWRGVMAILGISPDEQHRQAIELARNRPTPPPAVEPQIVYDERYPNRARAAKAARALGYSEEAIAAVESDALKSDDDLSPDEWLEEMRTENRRRQRSVLGRRNERPPTQEEIDELAPKLTPRKPKGT